MSDIPEAIRKAATVCVGEIIDFTSPDEIDRAEIDAIIGIVAKHLAAFKVAAANNDEYAGEGEAFGWVLNPRVAAPLLTKDEIRDGRRFVYRCVGKDPSYPQHIVSEVVALAFKAASSISLAEIRRLKVDASNHAADAEMVRRERDALIRGEA